MSLSVVELHDLLQLLREHPDWRGALRQELLTDELLDLPAAFRELAEAQARTERRVEELTQAQVRTERRVEELAQAQARTERRVEELAQAQARTERRVEELAQAQARTERRVEELAQAQERTERRIEELTVIVSGLVQAQERTNQRLDNLESITSQLLTRMGRLEGRVGNLEGGQYEQRYRDNAPSRLGFRLRRVERVAIGQLEPLLDALDAGQISEEEWDDLASLDLLVRGRAGRGEDAREVYYAVEISITVDRGDVTRAHQRAAILVRAGLPVEACVAGQSIRTEAQEAAQELGVNVLIERIAA